MTRKMLSRFEKEYLDAFGRFYEARGMQRAVGQIYALLAYKADNANNGLTQIDIGQYINRSISTVSRSLRTLTNLDLCDFTENVNIKGRLERKYYLSSYHHIWEMLTKRFELALLQDMSLKSNLYAIPSHMSEKEKKQYSVFLDHLRTLDESLTERHEFYQEVVALSRKKFEK